MEHESAAQRSHLDRLPPELIHAILCKLEDFTTLRCAVLSCRLLYNVFSESPSAIATRTVVNELDSCDVRPEAIAALQALKGFVKATLQDLVAMGKDGCSSQSLESPMPEKCRIMRALYLVEVFFNVFRQTSIPNAKLLQCMNDFFLAFAHWEVEQIAFFNDMAAHDVFWGEFNVEPALWFCSQELQSILFKGLVTLETLKEFSHRVANDQDASVSNFENSSVYRQNQTALRKGGYMMWDRARIDALGILRDGRQPQIVRGFLPGGLVGEVSNETWRSSWRERSRIYEEGGSGWWDFGNESKIVWARKKLAKTNNAPTSLDEAKRAIVALKRP
ncbi:hypothetical protein GGR58DRAFT_509752 [Xylaria digitata]|nr:hypothetical protein GGR58DRAFT_509752 [Xylaria digitata]